MAVLREITRMPRRGRVEVFAPTRVPRCRCAGGCRCGGLVPGLLLRQIERECEFFRGVL